MSMPADNGDESLRYAEYVLGVLDADARAAVAREIESIGEAATAVALWQRRLLPLCEEIAPVAPAPYVWARIRSALQLESPARAQPRKGMLNSLPLWHWIGVGASVVALAAVGLLMTRPPPAPAPTAVSAGYLVSAIQQDNGVTGWTATMDLQHAQMVVVPASPAALAQGRAPELWLIPAGQKPIALGLITRDKPLTLALDAKLKALLGPSAVLAVSEEPMGGSPTGQPTGAVIAKGTIRGAAT